MNAKNRQNVGSISHPAGCFRWQCFVDGVRVWGWGGLGWGGLITFFCTCTCCYASGCLLACAHVLDAMPLDVFLHVLEWIPGRVESASRAVSKINRFCAHCIFSLFRKTINAHIRTHTHTIFKAPCFSSLAFLESKFLDLSYISCWCLPAPSCSCL